MSDRGNWIEALLNFRKLQTKTGDLATLLDIYDSDGRKPRDGNWERLTRKCGGGRLWDNGNKLLVARRSNVLR